MFGEIWASESDISVGRHRWVEYAEKGRYNASQVPPEWHGWLHHVTDHTGDEVSPPTKVPMILKVSIWFLFGFNLVSVVLKVLIWFHGLFRPLNYSDPFELLKPWDQIETKSKPYGSNRIFYMMMKLKIGPSPMGQICNWPE